MCANNHGPIPFLDWYEVWPGATGYESDGRAWVSEAPRGVRLSVQPAEKSQPILVADQPWEQGQVGGESVLLEDGRFRMWYRSKGGLCYAESDDGFHWEKPRLGLIAHNGSTANNLVYGHGIAGNVFRDPSAREEERYKFVDLEASWVYRGEDIPEAQALRLRDELLQASSTQAHIEDQLSIRGAVHGAVSPDGLRWTRIAEPLFVKFCDTQNIVYYDEVRKKYIGHWRASAGGRRSIARSETDEFRRWPLPQIVLQPDAQDAPTDDYYTNAYCAYPGSDQYHLMFPAIYRRVSDTVDVQLAVSRDGFNWSWPERKPVIGLGQPGSGESGWVYAGSSGLLPLGGDRWGLIYSGGDELHNETYYYERNRQDGQIRWAMWLRDRLVALEAPVYGQVTLNRRRCQAERLLLNYRTEPNGWIRVELMEPTLWPPAHVPPLTGYSFGECSPVHGDELEGEVRWRGSADLSGLKGREICLRIELCRAKLFSVCL